MLRSGYEYLTYSGGCGPILSLVFRELFYKSKMMYKGILFRREWGLEQIYMS
jgi:hypothetical protein